MLSSLLFAAVAVAAAPSLGAWPESSGPAAALVEDVEFYLVEPEDDFYVVAVQALQPSIAAKDEQAVTRLARLAVRLGADAVVLLGETPEASIPEDVETPLPTTGRFSVAVFIVFDDAAGMSDQRSIPAMAEWTSPGRFVAAVARRGSAAGGADP